jgi:signal transduction histidine kinase
MLQTQTFFSAYYIIIGTAAMLFFVIFFYLFFLQMHRRRAIHEKEIYDLKVQYERTLFESQIEIQEQTFRNISQEIHDNIGQVLSLAKLNLNTIPQMESSDKIALTEELLGKAISDLRDLSKSLHPEKIVDIGLTNAIQNELWVMQKAAKLSTELITGDEEIKLSDEKCIIVFRMMQEILHNILKHAKAKNVKVKMYSNDNYATIEIIDDGKGFDIANLKSTETGIGLKSIQQRCALINASFNINSTAGVGTSIKLIINNS